MTPLRFSLRLRLLLASLWSLAAGACGPSAPLRFPDVPSLADGALQIIVFDVGQADAMLLVHKGKSMLIDAGASRGRTRRGMGRIPPRLDALLGGRTLDYFLVSHFHQDHVGMPGRTSTSREPGGLYALIERYGVRFGTLLDRGYWTLGQKRNTTQRNFERALPAWLATGAIGQRRILRVGDLIDMGDGLRVEVLASSTNGLLERLAAVHPPLFERYSPSENDYSLALKITKGDFELFTGGDLSGENVLRRFGSNFESYTDVESHIAEAVGAVELYRVDHHGSSHSSNACFVDVLQPRVSVFSTGENGYGHPAVDVFKRVRRHGDAYITGGADPRVAREVAEAIVGDDIEVVVAPGGEAFWVNGRRYESSTDAAEAARPGARATCRESAESILRGADPYGGELGHEDSYVD